MTLSNLSLKPEQLVSLSRSAIQESLAGTPSTLVLGKEASPLVVLEPTFKFELLPMGKNRSKDFRFVFINAFGARVGDNDLTLTLGMHEGGDPKDMLEEVAIVMTPKTLKIMLNDLGNVLNALESQIGEIPVPPAKLPSSLDEMIKSGAAVLIGGPEKTAVKKPKKKPKK